MIRKKNEKPSSANEKSCKFPRFSHNPFAAKAGVGITRKSTATKPKEQTSAGSYATFNNELRQAYAAARTSPSHKQAMQDPLQITRFANTKRYDITTLLSLKPEIMDPEEQVAYWDAFNKMDPLLCNLHRQTLQNLLTEKPDETKTTQKIKLAWYILTAKQPTVLYHRIIKELKPEQSSEEPKEPTAQAHIDELSESEAINNNKNRQELEVEVHLNYSVPPITPGEGVAKGFQTITEGRLDTDEVITFCMKIILQMYHKAALASSVAVFPANTFCEYQFSTKTVSVERKSWEWITNDQYFHDVTNQKRRIYFGVLASRDRFVGFHVNVPSKTVCISNSMGCNKVLTGPFSEGLARLQARLSQRFDIKDWQLVNFDCYLPPRTNGENGGARALLHLEAIVSGNVLRSRDLPGYRLRLSELIRHYMFSRNVQQHLLQPRQEQVSTSPESHDDRKIDT